MMSEHPGPCPCDECSEDAACIECGERPCYFAIVGSAPANIPVCSVDCGWKHLNPDHEEGA